MASVKNLLGERYGRLVVIAQGGKNKNGNARWLCQCDCGSTKVVASYDLRSGNTRSCGCIKQEQRHVLTKTHGESGSPLYKLWAGILIRCNPEKSDKYPDYAGRGISVCDEWKKYENFREWALSHGYQKGLTIDRIDVNGNYSPGNCRFVTYKVQENNRRNNRLLVFRGKTQTMAQWADELGIPYKCLEHRINRGWNVADALTTPVGGRAL